MGSLLSATTLDGNNGLFPIAFVVVETENILSWHWFITNLKNAFGGELQNITVISEQEKGLKDANVHLMQNTYLV